MPPAQCPECGRFLAAAFVQNLVTEPADCPKCGTRLSPAHFPEELGQAAAPDGPAEEPAAAAELRDDATPDPDPGGAGDVPLETAGASDGSVRPPDLDPGAVQAGDDGRPDPLASWDRRDADVVDLDRFRSGRQPPPDAAILGGAGLAGALVGALLADRRGRGAAFGLAVGLGAAAVARQVWRLPE